MHKLIALSLLYVQITDYPQMNYCNNLNLNPSFFFFFFQVSTDERALIEKSTIGQSENPAWFKHRYGRITASNAKAYCGKGNPLPLVRAVLLKNSSTKTVTHHMRYGLENEGNAISAYLKQSKDQNISVRLCGLFIDIEHGQLAASPDRVAVINGEEVLLEVKCLSASCSLSPRQAVSLKQRDGNFPFRLVGETVTLKDKHKYFTQVQMQMGVTGITKCQVIIFTNLFCDVVVVPVAFEPDFWNATKQKLLDFHAAYVVPALVSAMFQSIET